MVIIDTLSCADTLFRRIHFCRLIYHRSYKGTIRFNPTTFARVPRATIPPLNMKHSIFVESEPDFISFLKSIEDVIHKEVMKLYPNPNLPSLKWEQPDDNSITLFYRSPRQLCSLAEGLIKGAAEQYEVEYTMKHDVCTHNGDDHCRFEISVQ